LARSAVLSPSATPRLAAARRPNGRMGLLRGGLASRTKPNTAMLRMVFTAIVAGCDAAVVVGMALLTGAAYGPGADPHNDLVLGLTVAILFVVPMALHHEYAMDRYASFKGHAKQAFTVWSIAMLGAVVLAFVTKTSESFSRGGAIILFLAGFGGILMVRAVLIQSVRNRMAAGQIVGRHIFLVGDEAMIRAFTERHEPRQVGLRLVGASVLRPDPESLGDDLALAAASARVLRPDDVYILVPWAAQVTLEACINTFLRVPASIHLSSERFFDQFQDLHVARAGDIASLHLVRRPLSPSEVMLKRVFDIGAASLALLLLAPVFVLVALAIRLDSRGPVFFRQRRYGFNQEPFRIYKFRSMRTLEDDRTLKQATRGDSRITRVGRILRRTNLDELPQLVNVLLGDMSLVGPRPHALAHDQAFERDIALYARRHNVRPGITGWAQVNGWRGETDTPAKIEGRVHHDLYYIDNWSLLLDLTIIVKTLFSRRAYRNAG
jgi:Undecaprenyl-phosphate glucose phosphotransferase